MSSIKEKYLIFDLGGVIINLDMSRTFNEMARLGNITPEIAIAHFHNNENFKLYEKGLISDEEFRDFLKSLLKYEGEEQDLDEAWNAMILEIPKERLELLERLGSQHQLFLLSNTNAIHMRRVHEKLVPHGVNSFGSFFDKQYYSHLINRRKPDAEIYQFVLDENNLKSHEVLFIDDNADNINGAANLGIQTLHVNAADTLMNHFNGKRN